MTQTLTTRLGLMIRQCPLEPLEDIKLEYPLKDFLVSSVRFCCDNAYHEEQGVYCDKTKNKCPFYLSMVEDVIGQLTGDSIPSSRSNGRQSIPIQRNQSPRLAGPLMPMRFNQAYLSAQNP